MYSFQKGAALVNILKKLPWRKVASVAQLVMSVVDRTEQDALAHEASTGEKVAGALKKAMSREGVEKLVPALELIVGDRFDDAKVQSAIDNFEEAYIALQNAVRDAKASVNSQGSSEPSAPEPEGGPIDPLLN